MRTNKVVWNEGLFLRPQLFQQQERYLEAFAHQRAMVMTPYYWGLGRYQIDTQALEYGKLVIRSVQGLFSDGTPVNLPDSGRRPAPLTLLPQHCGQTLFLALPLSVDTEDETLFSAAHTGALARYTAIEQRVRDSNAISREPRNILLCQLSARVLPESELNDAWIGLPLAKLHSITANGRACLAEDDFIPAIIDIQASTLLLAWVTHLVEQLRHRAQSLAEQLSEGELNNTQGVRIEDYLLLQIFNQYHQLLSYGLQRPLTHPETLFVELLRLEAELATYLCSHHRLAGSHYRYQHGNLAASFRPLIDDITQQLSHLLARAGELIELHPQAAGTWSTLPQDSPLDHYQALVLRVSAAVLPPQLSKQFLQQVKISAPQQLQDLVRSHLPGLRLDPLSGPPRQLSHRPGAIYFELIQHGRDWQHILHQQALALHIAGDFPELSLQLWGLREI